MAKKLIIVKAINCRIVYNIYNTLFTFLIVEITIMFEHVY